MTKPRRLLHVDASPRRERSRSALVAAHFLARLSDTQVEHLALFDADLPDFDGAVIDARYALINGAAVPPQAAAAWDRIAAMVAHFLSFDMLLFSVPMWNFGIPYRLKQYIDLLTQPGLAFSVNAAGAVTGHATGRSAIIVAAGALDTRPGSDLGGMDFQVRYLQTWLGFIGVTDVQVIHVQPTYGDPAVVEAAMARAYAEAGVLAAALSRPDRV